ncbi:Nsp1-like C-terminal region-domain-containing protein [Cristinia sonorae]|uniref:Nucleoporin NSP1 n=1 Tax=Cristinia sonorae TaxID=1940300 RepID=A0A8K0UWI1_9AGAR|nr:Nsp1-like C-terminal region-domain-containing protein [Cristinia sonorae]
MFSNTSNQPNPPAGGLFGNTSNTTGAQNSTGSVFGGGTFGASAQPASGNLFGNSSTTPSTGGSLFGGATTAGQPSGAGSNLFGSTNTTQPSATLGSSTGGLFGAKPPTPSTGTTGTSGFNLPGGSLFGPPKPTEQSSASGTTTPSLFSQPSATTSSGSAPSGGLFGLPPKPAESTTTTAATAPTPSLFGGGLFNKPASGTTTPATGTSTTSGGLFGAATPGATTTTAPTTGGLFGAKPDSAAPSATTSSTGPSLPTLPPFSLGGTSSSTTTPASNPSVPNFFAKKPEEKKDSATAAPASSLFGVSKDSAGEKKDAPAPAATTSLFGATVTSTAEKKDAASTGASSAAAGAAPSTTTSSAVAVAPPSMLKGKSIEEIVNRWTNDLEVHVREFSKYASEVVAWDRALVENGNNLAALYSAVLAAEREQSGIDQSLDHIEQQQKDLSATLDIYEGKLNDQLGGQGGQLRALDTGPADAERDKNYSLATELHGHLDDLSGSLVQMIESVNALSTPATDNSKNALGEDPMSQIAQILSSHLESLQWIDGAVREVEGKVVDIEKRVRGAGEGPSNVSRSRGFGLGR